MNGWELGIVMITVGAASGILGWSLGGRRMARRVEREREATAASWDEILTAASRAIDTAQQRQDELTARLRRTQLEGHHLEQTLHQQAIELDRAEARVSDREATIDSLRAKLHGARASTGFLEEELTAKTEEIAELTNQLDALATGIGVELRALATTVGVDDREGIVVDLGGDPNNTEE